MSNFSVLDFKYRVFRCFAIFNCNTQTVIVNIQRQCGNLYQETILKVKDYVKQNIMDSQRNQLFLSTGDRSEWHGILEEKTNCYFLMMTFPGTQPAPVRQTLLDLQYTVMGINNYAKFTDQDFPKQKKDELQIRIDDLEQKYVQQHGPEGQPNENEKQPNISQQPSKISNSFLVSKPLPGQAVQQGGGSTVIQEQYRKNSVYRCFMVYNVSSMKILFMLRRGTSKSFNDTKDAVLSKLKTQINETTKFEFFMQGNIRSEWHGILDDQKSCYFLMMTFPSSAQKNVKDGLGELKKYFTSVPNYEAITQHDLEKKLKSEITKAVDNLEVKYFNVVGNEGVPSEGEEQKPSIIRNDFIDSNQIAQQNQPTQQQNQSSQQQNQSQPLNQSGNQQQKSSKIALNPPMSVIKENNNEGLFPPEFEDKSQNLLETAEISIQKELKSLEKYQPQASDAVGLLYVGIGFSFLIFVVLIVELYS